MANATSAAKTGSSRVTSREAPKKSYTKYFVAGVAALTVLMLFGAMFIMFIIMPGAAGGGANQALCSTGSPTDTNIAQAGPSPLALKDIPAVALDAYQKAGTAIGIDWSILAAIGYEETKHGTYTGGPIDKNGNTIPPIIGRALNGSGFGGNITPFYYKGAGAFPDGYDRAMGPMQHLLSEWQKNVAVDGNGDGKKDVQNIYDSSLATAIKIKQRGAPADTRTAVRRYNGSGKHAEAYADRVLKKAAEYRGAAAAVPGTTTPINNTGANNVINNVSSGSVFTNTPTPATPTPTAGASSGGSMGDGFARGSYGGYSRNADLPAGTNSNLAVGMRWASSQAGKMYLWGGGHAGGENDISFDCSGLVSWMLKKSGAKGVGGATTGPLEKWLKANGKLVDINGPLMAGDIIMYGTPKPHHTSMVWDGPKRIILHSQKRGEPIKFSALKIYHGARAYRVTALGAPDPGDFVPGGGAATGGDANDCASASGLTGPNITGEFKKPGPWGPYTQADNGRIPLSALAPVPWAPGHYVRPDGMQNLSALNDAYKARFGKNLCITDSYRTLAQQVSLKARKRHLAAKPGTSNHGWGLALDLCGGIQNFGTATHVWMKENAAKYGWLHPAWAQANGSKPEPWHWEFWGVPGGAANGPAGVNVALPTSGGGSPSANRSLAQQMAAASGWTGAQWTCLDKVWSQESGFNHLVKNPDSSAYGIPQSLPGKKMASAGADWRTNPATQVKWGISYIKGRYGNPCKALAHKYATGTGGRGNGWY